jgi:AraC-like DNA-binding protein
VTDVGELAHHIERNATTDGEHATAIPRLFLHRSSAVSEPLHMVYQPAVCLVAQGRKQGISGDRVYVYDALKYLVVSVDVPIISQVLEASPHRPYLCLRLDLDPAAIAALMLDADMARAEREPPGPALAVSAVGPDLLDAAIRLLRLLETPRDVPVLAPLAEREILYRLLRGEQAQRMSQIACAESKLQQVNRAIGWIKHNFREPFSIGVLAAEARMSASALHQHFRTVTGMSPLRYQKQLRLQEARRLMLSHALDAAVAGHRVGYESPSQFSREYRRLFGVPPARDIQQLRTGLAGMSAEASIGLVSSLPV